MVTSTLAVATLGQRHFTNNAVQETITVCVVKGSSTTKYHSGFFKPRLDHL